MVEAAPSCALLGGFAIGAWIALLWQHNANPSYKLASITRYDQNSANGRLGGVCALLVGDWQVRERSQNCVPYMDSGRGWLASDWPSTITAGAWTAGFHWWRSGNKKRTQNVSEYTVVLALCLVIFVNSQFYLCDTLMYQAVTVSIHTHLTFNDEMSHLT